MWPLSVKPRSFITVLVKFKKYASFLLLASLLGLLLSLTAHGASQSFDWAPSWPSGFSCSVRYSYNSSSSSSGWTSSTTSLPSRTGSSFQKTYIFGGSGNYGTSFSGYDAPRFTLPLNELLVDNDYVLYWKLVFVASVTSSNPSVAWATSGAPVNTNLVYFPAALRFQDDSGTHTTSMQLQQLSSGSGLYVFTCYLQIDQVNALMDFYWQPTIQLKGPNTSASAIVSFDVSRLSLVPTNEAEYEAWQSSQRIEDVLTQSPDDVTSSNAELESSAGVFSGAVSDFQEASDSLARPEPGKDFAIDFDSVTGGMYSEDFVSAWTTPIFGSVQVLSMFLICGTLMLFGYILFGKKE